MEETGKYPSCVCKTPKSACKCDKKHCFRLYGTEDIVQCGECGTWWKSKAKYVKTLPIKGLSNNLIGIK